MSQAEFLRRKAADLRAEAERHAADLLRIAGELDGIVQTAPQMANALPAARQELLPSHYVTIGVLAGHLRTSEKTARKIASGYTDARIEIAGRIYYDESIIGEKIRATASSRVLP